MQNQIEAALAAQHKEMKETCSWWAVVVWLISGGIFFIREPRRLSLVGWAVYVLIGSFAASFILGGSFYLLQRGIAKLAMLREKWPSTFETKVISMLGVELLVGEIVATYCAARWVVGTFAF